MSPERGCPRPEQVKGTKIGSAEGARGRGEGGWHRIL